jgi:hypothetical protein
MDLGSDLAIVAWLLLIRPWLLRVIRFRRAKNSRADAPMTRTAHVRPCNANLPLGTPLRFGHERLKRRADVP